MCTNCGINHETSELEDQDAFDAFLNRAFSVPEVRDYMAEYRTEPDVTLTGPFNGGEWRVEVAKLGGTSDVDKLYEVGEVWIVNVYTEDQLDQSAAIEASKPISTRQVAEEFAEFRFGYEA